jgi:hypothetical protein
MAVEIFKEKWGADSEGSLTLKYLGIALAPLGDNYARRAEMGDVPVIADAGRTYTPEEIGVRPRFCFLELSKVAL